MPPPRDEYEKTLDKLAALLKRRPMTARAIAKALDCCKPAAYDRLKALQTRGDAVYRIKAPQASTGPKAFAYVIR